MTGVSSSVEPRAAPLEVCCLLSLSNTAIVVVALEEGESLAHGEAGEMKFRKSPGAASSPAGSKVPASLCCSSSPSRGLEAAAQRWAGWPRGPRAPAVGEQRPPRAPRVLTPAIRERSRGRGGSARTPRQSSSLGRRRSPGPYARPPGAVCFAPLLLLCVGTGPRPPRAGQQRQQGRLPRAGWRTSPGQGPRDRDCPSGVP